jgi:uridine monophosphate synthetase
MANRFFQELERSCREKNSLLCVGLDPRLEPEEPREPGRVILERNRRVIEETLPFTACYKPNVAFYEAYGPEGLQALERTLRLIPEGTPVILDAKRGDIGQTGKAYAQAIFGRLGVGSATVSPYLGRESVAPLLAWPGKALFALCRTSNPESNDLQRLLVSGPGCERTEAVPLYLVIAREAASWGEGIGLVMGATDIEALETVRQALPEVWFLCPGIGPQGGSLEQAVRAGRRRDRLGILPAVSRAVYQDPDPGEAARLFRDRINRERDKPFRPLAVEELGGQMAKIHLLERLIDHGCLQFGQFQLKSGQVSPYYLDLRKIISSPPLLARVADAYLALLKRISFDRIAAVPLAALPIAAAVSLKLGVPFVYPRLVLKEHGTGNSIEGDFNPEDRVVLLDDVISTARSKLEAIEVLKREGLRITDLVVLVDRESGGCEEIERHGVRCHSYARISELLELAAGRGVRSAAR